MGFLREVTRRGAALLTAAATLWTVQVTAGSTTVSDAAQAILTPLAAVRWELGDLRQDALSPAVVLAIGESPLLLSARAEVTALWAREEEPDPPPAAPPEPAVRPVTETPVEAAPPPQDNGVPARTLLPNAETAYARVGTACISSSVSCDLTGLTPLEPPADAGSGSAPLVLILHSHGSECYTPAGEPDIAYTGDHRTDDSRYNVVRVGDAMAQVLADAGIAVIHDRTLHDVPDYAGAYGRSLAAAERYLAEYPSLRYVLDVHRDAVEDAAGNQYKVVSDTEEGTAAQMTLVVGSDGSGLPHPGWRENLRLAAALQQRLTARCPTLMRPILLRNSRYNQHVSPGALLVEVGAAGNAPEEAVLAGELLAQELAAYVTGE